MPTSDLPTTRAASVPRVDWRAAFIVATGLVVLFTLQNSVAPAGPPLQSTLRRTLTVQAIAWYTWLLLLPLIIAVARRFRGGNRLRLRDLPAQLAIAAGVALLHGALAGFARWALGVSVARDVGVAVTNFAMVNFASGFIRYCMIATVYHAVAYYHEARAREVGSARLEASLAQAKLENLQGKLHPHFLFNTLNSIAALIRDNPRAAEEMVGNLGELLRASLSMSSASEISLAQELALLEKYTAIERVRFQERLRVDFNVPELLRPARVPQLLLQPLVENAIRHGLAPREEVGSVRVRAERVNGRLRIQVIDDGVGMSVGGGHGDGIGLGATRERLRHFYGDDQRLEIGPGHPSGTVVTVELPCRLDAAT